MTDSIVIGASTGISVSGTSSISNSVIAKCDIGLLLIDQSTTTISGSNFSEIDQLNLQVIGSGSATATGNYWSFGTSEEIEQTILHQADDINLGLVTFTGFLTEPNSDTPIPPLEQVLKESAESSLALRWQAPTGKVSGYKVYSDPDNFGEYQSSIDVGFATEYELEVRVLNDEIAVTFYTSDADGTDDILEGHESWYSIASIATHRAFLFSPISSNSLRSL